jgi:Uma2 family endonuclease
VGRLVVAIDRYLSDNRLGHVFTSPADISWGPDVLVQPDVFVVTLEQARSLDWSEMKNLLLAVEVLSPSTARHASFGSPKAPGSSCSCC